MSKEKYKMQRVYDRPFARLITTIIGVILLICLFEILAKYPDADIGDINWPYEIGIGIKNIVNSFIEGFTTDEAANI